ncbi:hypothetical protein KP509_34G002000 [Ceratopteris richardii]|uniref:Uncharacterized protein n=1 Tax=Ceratopteris richardii TaxID=49495 RepID=A0A8T2QHW7_CERRI|nr:hypothetical protein KP509_34G002000 [Ceratopteris richardii]
MLHGVKCLNYSSHMFFIATVIFPSSLVEEQPLHSLTGTFKALHADIGALVFPDVPPAKLIRERIFFYTHEYIVPSTDGEYGRLEIIKVDSLLSLEWPKPDFWSISSFKRKMVMDIHNSLKFTRVSRSIGLHWTLPIHCFVFIFQGIPFVETPTMFLCKDITYEAVEGLLGENWGYVEGLSKGDRYRCRIGDTGIGFRYLKHRTSLYIRFYYDRWMCKLGEWIPLQSSEGSLASFEINVKLPNNDMEVVLVNQHWNLANLREHLLIMGYDDLHDFKFRIRGNKIGKRLEDKIKVLADWSMDGTDISLS